MCMKAFDEIPSMALKDLKQIVAERRTHTGMDIVKKVYPPKNTVCAGIMKRF